MVPDAVKAKKQRQTGSGNTDKKENKIFLIYKEIQRDRVQSLIQYE
jgi:hypothetical protein